MSEYKPTKNEDELCDLLKKIIKDSDTFVGTMLMLTVNQPDPDGNCKQLLDFIKNNPDAGYDEVLDKADEIMDIEDPFADEDEDDGD